MNIDHITGNIIIIGCGGHARSVADVIIDNMGDVNLTFFDKFAKKNEVIMGRYPVKKLADLDLTSKDLYFLAIGNNHDRKELFTSFEGISLLTIVSKRAHVSTLAKIGRGCFVGVYSHIGPEVQIGDNCIINSGAIVEHESRVGNHCHISVGAKICGRTRIEDNVFIGAGATVVDKLYICNDVTVGAGATVVDDIKEPGIYVGVPAVRVR